MDWKRESEMFDRAATEYDRFRPGYPEELIAVLCREAGLQAGADLLEIGAGSGKFTRQLVGRGFRTLCIEPGETLVRLGRERFAREFPGEAVEFRAARFEDCALPASAFDAVVSAQAFHWVPQPVGYDKCAEILRPGGWLALIWNMYAVSDSPADRELLALSARHGGFADFLTAGECETRVRSVADGIAGSGRFARPAVYRKRWCCAYTAAEYCGFVRTGNRFLQKPEAERQAAYRDIEAFAERQGGRIARVYDCALYLARRL